VTSNSAGAVSEGQKGFLSLQWHDRLSRLITRGKKATALALLEQTIERSLPLFRTDRAIFESRRTAWLIRTHLLLEWNRPAEALAWTCLECQLSSESRDAKALRDRLLRQLNLDFDPPETAPDRIAVETQWPGVAGMYEFKAKLERDVILSLNFPEEARRYGVPLPNGILLYGPPGCGKTFIARKIAEKLTFNFVEVKPGDLASIYVHGTQEKIKEAFEGAAAKAPTVLFFDELDAFTPKRQAAGHHYSAEVNEFLVRLNNCSEQKILVIGATNFLDRLDEAVLRAGRMDLHYYIGLPDFAARAELFKQHLFGRPCARLDWSQLAQCSAGYSPADIALIATQAARHALIERVPIGLPQLLKAMEEHPRQEQEVPRPRIGFRN
jgi:ATPase family associated with various cellular activities (AAA)